MPSLYGFTGNANVSVTNTTGLYQLSSNTGIVQNAYGNLNVAAYLPTYTGNVSSAGLGLSGIFTDHYYYANGAPFIGGSGGAGTYSNANVAAYLTTSTGNIQAGNITVLGNLYVQGNTITRYTANTIASQIIANGAIPSTSTTTGALQSYGGLGVQGNINAGAVYTNNYFYANGTPFASSSYGNSNVSAYMAGGTLGNIIVTGNVKAYGAIVSTNFTYPNGVSILSGVTANYGNANVTALLAGTVTIGNLTTVNGVFWPNGEPYSSGSVINTYGNANVAAYLSSNTDPTISNLNANTQQQQAQINTINANVTAANVNIQTISANLGAFETATNLSLAGANAAIAATNANIGSFYTYANATYSTQANAGSLQNQINGANAAIITANTAMKNYVDAGNTTMTNYVNNQVTTANTAMKNYVDAANTIQSNQITTLSNGQTGANASISALQANVGSFYTYANATYSTQANAGALQNQITGANVNIQTISANLGSFETYANATYSTQANAGSLQNQITGANVNIQTISANLGSFETYANATYSTIANAASLQSQITGANVAIVTANTAMKSYVDAANSIQSAQITTLQGQVYSNANAASYLTVYTGNIQAGNVSILTDLSVGGNTIITGNLTVYGNTTTINSNVITTNDLNITVGNNQTSGAALNNAGIDVGSNNLATWRFNNASTSWQSNINITPQSNAVYNLGAPTLQWNTIYGRDVQAATATYTGNVTAGNVSATNLTNQYNFLQGEIDGANAAIITANTAMKSYVDAANTVMTNYVNNQVTTANTAMKSYVDAANTIQSNQINTINNNIIGANAAIQTLSANVGAFETATNLSLAGANAAIQSTNANIGSFYTYANATYSTIANAASLQSQITGANAAIITANTAMKAYVDAANTVQSDQIQTISANLGAYEIYANAAITSINGNVTAANAAIQTLSANVGAFETATNLSLSGANAAIQSTNANIGSFYTYANATYSTISNAASQQTQINTLITQVYANANVSAYLPIYTGYMGGTANNINIYSTTSTNPWAVIPIVGNAATGSQAPFVDAALPGAYNSTFYANTLINNFGNSTGSINYYNLSGNIVYASTSGYDAGLGFWRSTDAGTTWSQQTTSTYATWYYHVPYYTGAAFVAGVHAGTGTTYGIYRSLDGGTSWTSTLANYGSKSNQCWATSGSNTIGAFERTYGSSGNAGGIWISSNNGASWTNAFGTGTSYTNGYVEAVYNTGTGRILAGISGTTYRSVYYSTDDGASWSATNAPYGMQPVSFLNTGTAILAGCFGNGTSSRGIWKSTDNGTNWSQVLSNGEYINTIVKLDSGILLAGTNSINGGIYRSLDGGDTWAIVPGSTTSIQGPLTATQGILSINGGTRILGGNGFDGSQTNLVTLTTQPVGLFWNGNTNTLNVAQGTVTAANVISTNGYYWANGAPYATSTIDNTYGNANVAAYLPTYNGNLGGTLTTAAQTNITSIGTLDSLNVTNAITGGSILTATGVYWSGNGQPYSTGGGSSTYGNANVAAYLPTDSTIIAINANVAGANAAQTAANTIQSNQINAINANVGSFYTYANATYSTQANAGSLQNQITGANAAIVTANTAMKSYVDAGNTIQSNQIDTLTSGQTAANAAIQTISANLGSFETWANANFVTTGGTYSNTNVTAYLAGTVSVGNIASANGYFWSNGTAYSTGGGSSGVTQIVAGTNLNISPSGGTGVVTINANTQPGTYTNSNVTNLLSGGTYTGDVIATTGVVNASAMTATGALTAGSYLQANNGLYSIDTFSGTYSDGIVVDYATGSGRISVGTADNLTFYTGGVAATQTLQLASNGAAIAGNLITTNGVFWSNGVAYSTGGGSSGVTSITAGTGITANAATGAVSITNAGVTAIVAGSGITANASTGVVSISSTGGGTTFNGNLLGNTLVDTTNNRVTINASPYSDPGIQPPLWQNMKNNPPVYIGGVLQPPTYPNINNLISNDSYLMFTTSNIGLQSSYQTTNTRFTNGILNYQSAWPVTANTMTNNDRLRNTTSILDLNMAGKSWGTTASSTFNAAVGVQQNFLNLYGNGYVTSGAGTGSVIYITPIGTALGTGLSANITYATGVVSAVQHQTTYGSTNTANITYARGYTAQVNLGSNSAAVTNAIGFHTPNGWVNAPNTTGGLNITNRYAILNEDQYSVIRTNGNIASTNNISINGYQETVYAINGGGSTSGNIAINYNNGTIQQLYLNGGWTLYANSISNMYPGSSLTIVESSGGSARTLTTSGLLWAGGAKTLSSYTDVVNIFYDGTNYYASIVTGYQS